jgi:transcriptional regulator with PAS, ATPase and Fis domain
MSELQSKAEPGLAVEESQDRRPEITGGSARLEIGAQHFVSAPDSSLRSFRVEAEIHAISRALEHTRWNRKRAAQLLRISYRSLLYKIRQHNITPGNELASSAPGGD